MTILTHSPVETETVGARLADKIRKSGERHVFVALFGEMGVGKTAFVRGFASALGCKNVKSPTYTLVNEYRTEPLPLFHFDMYRVTDEDDLYSIGFDDYLMREGICLTEWSERIEGEIPASAIRVRIARAENENDRILTLEGVTDADLSL